jgi:eukaryotic-like serine/threonine-protein kinase
MVLTPRQQLQKGKYTIEKELGRGRFGITYLATKLNGGKRTIKILDPDVLASLNVVERERLESKFWTEAVNLAKCSGTPHIVQIDTPFKDGTTAYLPMEYLDANSLADRNQQILSEEKALEYIRQIGEALAVVHQHGLVHCDIRPANIFLRFHGSKVDAVLADFGLALDLDTELSRTRDREYVDGFSPIELCSRNKAVGAYTDVYSLAATLYELLTGKIPVSARDRSQANIQLESPQTKNPEISATTNKAILSGMELMPDKRPQSIKDWLSKFNFDNQSPQKPENSGKSINWQKWGTIATWIGAIAAAITTIFLILPKVPGNNTKTFDTSSSQRTKY